ncbi:MAG: DUF4268 domain-containing protein [Nanoarchaeota archaeon]
MKMEKKDLGILKDVPLRNIFKRESEEFTPWLNDNITELNRILGIEIIDTQMEVSVGKFSLDILGTIAGSDKKVIIENQIEPTDHNHLGQLLTYASGINASIVIWVAKEFTEEHVSALEWLNTNMKEDVSFFGIALKAIQIDNSKPALNFDVIIKPNEWDRTLKSVKISSDTNIHYLNFYKELVENYNKINSNWKRKNPQPQNWLQFGAGKGGFYFGWSFGYSGSTKIFRTELYIDTGDEVANKDYFDRLISNKDKIESELGYSLKWERLDNRRACRTVLLKEINYTINNISTEEKRNLLDWATKSMLTFSKVFSKYIGELK